MTHEEIWKRWHSRGKDEIRLWRLKGKPVSAPCPTCGRSMLATVVITQEELATAAGVSRATVVEVESGRSTPKPSTLEKLYTVIDG